MSERTLLVGYNLCDKKTQIAVYNRDTREPELVGQSADNPYALFETAVGLDGMEPIRDFLPRIRSGEEIIVDGKVSQPVNILAYYFRKTLSVVRKIYAPQTIQHLVITVPDSSLEFVQIIYEALARLGIEKDRATVINHRQSYLYYTLYQKQELWINDVGMFDYDGENLHYYQMQLDRKCTPILAGVIEKDYSDSMEPREASDERKSVVFENLVQGAIHKQILSTLYMTGEGFEEEWMDEVLRRLCVGRRLFKGHNLYVNGACYAAKEFGDIARLTDYILLDGDMIRHDLSVELYKDAKEQEVVLAKAGTPWYQVDQTLEMIPDGESELCITVRDIFTKEDNRLFFELEPVIGKVDRNCRLAVRVRFNDVHTLVVTIKDMGFGEIYPTSNRIWEKTVVID